jgi:hypothetical protein
MIETRPPWNEQVPGHWQSLRRIVDVGSYIGDFVEYRGGCYRLIALADIGTVTPAIINRVCGSDETGTLYIGRGGWRSTVRFRLQQLVRSLTRWRVGDGEHGAGNLIRSNQHLKKMFPIECLAVTWTYEKHPTIAESNLLWHYFESFGEIQPLNVERGTHWLDVDPDLPADGEQN